MLKVKEAKPGQEMVKIYYQKGFCDYKPPAVIDLEKDYELVCYYPVWRVPGHSDYAICETLFELFNWSHEGFQPHDEELGFHKSEKVYHTSMSVGDVIQINDIKYVVDMAGFKKVA